MTGYVLTPAAHRDMAGIWFYTAERWDVDRADAYLLQIVQDIGRAIAFPNAGSPVTGLPPAYRKVPSGSHHIIYRLEGHELVVARVLHERQAVPDDIENF